MRCCQKDGGVASNDPSNRGRKRERDLPKEHRADDERAGITMEGLTLMSLLVSPASQLVHPISTVRCLLFLMLVESV